MADSDTALREVAELVSAVLRYSPAALEAEIRPLALRLGADAGPDAVERMLQAALGLTPDFGDGKGCTEAAGGFDSDGTRWALTATRDGLGLLVSVGFEDALLYGSERERFTEAVNRTAMPGQFTPLCPGGCGCRLGTEDADARECGCDGGCCGEDEQVSA